MTEPARRALAELVNTAEPGFDLVREWRAAAVRPVEILPCRPEDGEATLLALQVTTRSPMGAIAYATGGLLVDGGWLRILGGGCDRLPRTLATWNNASAPQNEHRLPGALLVADDVVGGFFAINGGGITGPPGHVHYLAPDTLEWEDTELGYSDFIHWTFTGDLPRFYESMRWPTWQSEASQLAGDRALSIYPFLWAEGPPIADRARKPVPVDEMWSFACELRRQLTAPRR